MGKLRFPKEKPEITQQIEDAEKLLEQSPDDAQAVMQAYKSIVACAEQGSPRAKFIEASFLYLDEPEAGEYKYDILAALDAAEKAKYPLAGGMKIEYISTLDNPELLYKTIRQTKGESPQSLYYEAGFFAGIDAPAGVKENLAKAAEYFERSARMYLEYDRIYRAGCRELSDIAICYRNPDYFTEQAAYAYQMLLYVYAEMDVKANVQKYVEAYEKAQQYGNFVVIYKTAATRATDCMHNVMGMHSLKTVNAVLKTAKEAYAQLTEAQRDRLKNNYESLWAQYDTFYDSEMQRLEALGNMEVYTSPDYARQDSLMSDFANAVRQWSETRPEKESYTVTIGNDTFTLNDLGEMVDRYGQSNGLRVDTTSKKVYDSRNNAVGFFDSFGEYHKY